MNSFKYIDLFAGAGGLSEGFIRAGFESIAHVECDKASCYTLQTRKAFHYLKNQSKEDIYHAYIKGQLSRKEFYNSVPKDVLDCVINAKIGEDNHQIFKKIDSILNKDCVDLIVGGPPCQAYSYMGRAALKHKKEDERNTLYIHYGRFLKKYKPKIFVFENVPGLLTAGGGIYFKNLKKYYKRLGYEIESQLLNAFDYGVVQNRERLFILGWKKNIDFSFPKIKTEQIKYYRDDIFFDLPAIEPGESKRFHLYSMELNEYLNKSQIRNGVNFVTQHITRPHNKKDLAIYKLAIQKLENGLRLKNNQIPQEMRTQNNLKDFLDRFKVVDSKPHAMIAHIAKDGHHFIHPDKKQLRSISVREAARIQSFPDDYYFEGIKEVMPRTSAFKQIGNAVPPLLSERIAKAISRKLKNL